MNYPFSRLNQIQKLIQSPSQFTLAKNVKEMPKPQKLESK